MTVEQIAHAAVHRLQTNFGRNVSMKSIRLSVLVAGLTLVAFGLFWPTPARSATIEPMPTKQLCTAKLTDLQVANIREAGGFSPFLFRCVETGVQEAKVAAAYRLVGDEQHALFYDAFHEMSLSDVAADQRAIEKFTKAGEQAVIWRTCGEACCGMGDTSMGTLTDYWIKFVRANPAGTGRTVTVRW